MLHPEEIVFGGSFRAKVDAEHDFYFDDPCKQAGFNRWFCAQPEALKPKHKTTSGPGLRAYAKLRHVRGLQACLLNLLGLQFFAV